MAAGDDKQQSDLPDLDAIFAAAAKNPVPMSETMKKIIIDMESTSLDPSPLMHEMPHMISAPLGAGKTATAKAIAKSLGIDIVTIDASKLGSDVDLNRMMGPPKGFVATLTPEEEAALAEKLAGFDEKWRLAASRESGEKLAAACHDGIAEGTTALKPFRLKSANNGFMTMRGIWQ